MEKREAKQLYGRKKKQKRFLRKKTQPICRAPMVEAASRPEKGCRTRQQLPCLISLSLFLFLSLPYLKIKY